jgi:para-aminobenzoate synthetase/4-amino-4-deoxychorismate lyase
MRHDALGLRHAALHLDRLAASAGWFGFPFDRVALEQQLRELAPVDRPHRLRVVLAVDGSVGIEPELLAESHVPVRLAIDTVATQSDDPFCCHKTTWRRHYTEAMSRQADADDVVLVNEHGNAMETTVANLLYRVGGQWFTPSLGDGGLPGIARQVAIASGEVLERSIRADELATCVELAVLNDLRGRRPAVLVAQTVHLTG